MPVKPTEHVCQAMCANENARPCDEHSGEREEARARWKPLQSEGYGHLEGSGHVIRREESVGASPDKADV